MARRLTKMSICAKKKPFVPFFLRKNTPAGGIRDLGLELVTA